MITIEKNIIYIYLVNILVISDNNTKYNSNG